jgi:hypothetical protein
MALLGITLGSLNQYLPGGVALQLANNVGLSGSAMNQYYATGGFRGQLTSAGGCSGTTFDQYYATGGALGQFMNAATGTTGVTGFAAAQLAPHHASAGPAGHPAHR